MPTPTVQLPIGSRTYQFQKLPLGAYRLHRDAIQQTRAPLLPEEKRSGVSTERITAVIEVAAAAIVIDPPLDVAEFTKFVDGIDFDTGYEQLTDAVFVAMTGKKFDAATMEAAAASAAGEAPAETTMEKSGSPTPDSAASTV
jgi:hypothetical protein